MVHSPICFPSGEQTDWPADEHVPVDDDDVEGFVEPDEELVMAEGAELGTAATTGEAAAGGAAAAAATGVDPEAALYEAGAGPVDPDPDDPLDPVAPDPDVPDEPDAPDAPDDPEDPDEDIPAADALEFDPEFDPDAPHLAPVGGVSVPLPNFSTEAPGSGNCTSCESTVSQSVVGMFALNMAGKDGAARTESS